MKIEPLLDPKQVAAILGVSVRTVYRLAGRIRVPRGDRRLPAVSVGRCLRFVVTDVAKFIEKPEKPLRARRRRR